MIDLWVFPVGQNETLGEIRGNAVPLRTVQYEFVWCRWVLAVRIV